MDMDNSVDSACSPNVAGPADGPLTDLFGDARNSQMNPSHKAKLPRPNDQ